MESVEISAKTVEEAIQTALQQLGLSQEQVEITVLQKGKSGIFGLGSEEARVRVTPLAPQPDHNQAQMEAEEEAHALAKEVADELIKAMKLSITATVIPLSPDAPLTVNMEGKDAADLIGRRGYTLSCFQYIMGLILAHRLKAQIRVNVDVEGYKERRSRTLRGLARRTADQVKTTGEPVTLEPMPASERRLIHLALADDNQVTTQSVGQGEFRKVSILPRKYGSTKLTSLS